MCLLFHLLLLKVRLFIKCFFVYRVRILGLDNLRDCFPEFDVVYVDVAVFHGGEELCTPALSTQEIPFSKYPRWNQWLVFNILVKNLPKVSVVISLLHVTQFLGRTSLFCCHWWYST